MAAKRKQKRTKTPDTMGPSPWRLQHGDFTPPIREADPETGRPVQHRRAVDTLGMMLANVPAVVLGDRIAHRMPVRLVHSIAAAVFALLGVATLAGAGERFGF